jgi:hypothetical protein
MGWARSAINKSDLTKAKRAGFLPESSEVIFPGDEVVPHPDDGYRHYAKKA